MTRSPLFQHHQRSSRSKKSLNSKFNLLQSQISPSTVEHYQCLPSISVHEQSKSNDFVAGTFPLPTDPWDRQDYEVRDNPPNFQHLPFYSTDCDDNHESKQEEYHWNVRREPLLHPERDTHFDVFDNSFGSLPTTHDGLVTPYFPVFFNQREGAFDFSSEREE